MIKEVRMMEHLASLDIIPSDLDPRFHSFRSCHRSSPVEDVMDASEPIYMNLLQQSDHSSSQMSSSSESSSYVLPDVSDRRSHSSEGARSLIPDGRYVDTFLESFECGELDRAIRYEDFALLEMAAESISYAQKAVPRTCPTHPNRNVNTYNMDEQPLYDADVKDNVSMSYRNKVEVWLENCYNAVSKDQDTSSVYQNVDSHQTNVIHLSPILMRRTSDHFVQSDVDTTLNETVVQHDAGQDSSFFQQIQHQISEDSAYKTQTVQRPRDNSAVDSDTSAFLRKPLAKKGILDVKHESSKHRNLARKMKKMKQYFQHKTNGSKLTTLAVL